MKIRRELMQIMLAVSVMLVISTTAAAAQSVCRDLPAGDQTPGATFTVDLIVELEGADTYAIEDNVPAGLVVVSAPDGSISGNTVRFVKLGGGTNGTLSYTVKVPDDADAGSYTFTGEYGIGPNPSQNIECDTNVEVSGNGGNNGDANVCRDLPDGDVSPGATFTVDLIVELAGEDTYAIEDNVPAGLEVVSAPDGSISGNTVRFVKLGGGTSGTLSYTVKVPDDADAGSYTFTGEYGIGPNPSQNIECDTNVEVSGEGGGDDNANVCRDLPDGDVAPGATFTVDLIVELAGEDTYAIEDNVPAGLEIVSAPDGSITGNTVRFVKLGDGTSGTLTYTVRVPEDAVTQSYTFTGQYGIGTDSLKNIDCDTEIEVALVPFEEGIVLKNGWNFISVPCVLENDSVADVMEGVDYEAIVLYDASGKVWKVPTSIKPLTGYAIKVNNSTNQVITNIACSGELNVPASVQLYKGWNAVGLTGLVPKTAEFTFYVGDIDDNYSKVWGPWDPVMMKYKYHGYNQNVFGDIPGGEMTPDVYTEHYTMKPFEGHWVYLTENAVLSAIA